MQYYDTLAQFERNGFDIIVDKTWEDLSPRDLFEESDVDEVIRKIDNGVYDWFMLRVRVLVEGLELGSAHCSGCCYEDAREVLTDGLAEDMIGEALKEAHRQVYPMYKRFQELSFALDSEGINA